MVFFLQTAKLDNYLKFQQIARTVSGKWSSQVSLNAFYLKNVHVIYRAVLMVKG